MDALLEKLRVHVLGWTTSAAATLTAFQLIAPNWLDWILNIMVVGLVYIAAKLAKQK